VSLRLLALIPLAVGINLAMGKIAAVLALPMFLDTIGTLLVATLVGLPVAVATAVVSQLALGLWVGAVQLAFLPIHLLIAIYASLVVVRFGVFRTPVRAVGFGLIIGAAAGTMAWPIAYLAFGGVTSPGVSLVTTLLNAVGLPLQWAVYIASLSTDLLDKGSIFLLVFFVLRALPKRTLNRFPRAEAAFRKST
jgi:energy-coupling factor transport system substrate-specific component